MITTWPPPLMRVQIASSVATDAGAERRAPALGPEGPNASRRDRPDLDTGVVGRLTAWNARVETLARLGGEARLAARQGVEARPSIAGPDHAGKDVLGHPRDGFEAAPLIGELHSAAGGDPAGSRVLRVNPQLGVRLGSLEHGQGAPIIVERMERGQHAPLAKL